MNVLKHNFSLIRPQDWRASAYCLSFGGSANWIVKPNRSPYIHTYIRDTCPPFYLPLRTGKIWNEDKMVVGRCTYIESYQMSGNWKIIMTYLSQLLWQYTWRLSQPSRSETLNWRGSSFGGWWILQTHLAPPASGMFPPPRPCPQVRQTCGPLSALILCHFWDLV